MNPEAGREDAGRGPAIARGSEALPTARLVFVDVDPQGADAMALLGQAAVEAQALYPELHDPARPGPVNAPTPVGGCYLLACLNGQPVGCGALRPLAAGQVELRRMYVTGGRRRRGIARALLRELEDRAVRLGYCTMRLETGCRQLPALALYEASGYRHIEPFGAHVGDPTSVCFEKDLPEPPRQAVRADIAGMHRVRMAVRENRLCAGVIAEADYVDAIERRGRGWVVEQGGEIVAFAVGNALDGNIWALFVAPGHEGRGHGRRLHDTMVDWLFAQGLPRLWLGTEANTRARRFYGAAGWQACGVSKLNGEDLLERWRPG